MSRIALCIFAVSFSCFSAPAQAGFGVGNPKPVAAAAIRTGFGVGNPKLAQVTRPPSQATASPVRRPSR